MQTAGHTLDEKADPNGDASESSRDPAPSGGAQQAQNIDQNSTLQRVGHECEGARCPCQRYENGELALVVMNRNRNPGLPDREDCYQNMARGAQPQQQRVYQNRGNNGQAAVNPNFLNPQYQNPVDLLRNYQRNGRVHEPEENIYERLDGEEEEEEINDPRAEGVRNENPGNAAAVEPSDDNHTYERIDNRPWYRGGASNANRGNNCPPSGHLPAANFWNFIDPGNHNAYDHPRYANPKSRALDSQSCVNRLGRLGRNCFSSENIASATANSRRYVYQLGHNRMCQSCARFPFMYRDARYVCQHCNSFHERLRYYEPGNPAGTLGNSRHYIYQVPRSCRCAFCRGEYQYARFPMNSSRLAESFRRDCQCRNPGSCNCRGRMMSSSNSAIYIGRIDRVGLAQSVNNPLYSSPTIYIGRIDRSCASVLGNGSATVAPNSSEAGGGIAAAAPIPSTSNEPSTSTNQRANVAGPSTSGASSVCPIDQSIERQHVCDDSCIRSHPGNVTGVCQFLGRSERPDCHNGRVSFHWWFVNRWLPTWGSQSTERNAQPPATPPVVAAEQAPPAPRAEEPREPQESDTEESRD